MNIKPHVLNLLSPEKRLVVRVKKRKLERSKLPYRYTDTPSLSILI